MRSVRRALLFYIFANSPSHGLLALCMLRFTSHGIYCEVGDFYIDPWRPVDRAVITHAHADHSRWGMKHYLAHHDSLPVMRHRLGEISAEGLAYGEVRVINGVKLSLYPAGHIIGSAQVRVEHKGEIWVASGDYNTRPDAACTPFEPVKCNHFITESTFGLPVFHWKSDAVIFEEIMDWWRHCRAQGKNAVLFAYSLGKAQRILNGLPDLLGPVACHAAVENTNEVLREAGHAIRPTIRVEREHKKGDFQGALIIAPPGADGSAWLKRFGPHETAFASGWMQVRGTRRRRNMDRGFVLSDHADWDGLLAAVHATGAEHVHVTHGYSSIFSAYLAELGLDAQAVGTRYGEDEDGDDSNKSGEEEA